MDQVVARGWRAYAPLPQRNSVRHNQSFQRSPARRKLHTPTSPNNISNSDSQIKCSRSGKGGRDSQSKPRNCWSDRPHTVPALPLELAVCAAPNLHTDNTKKKLFLRQTCPVLRILELLVFQQVVFTAHSAVSRCRHYHGCAFAEICAHHRRAQPNL